MRRIEGAPVIPPGGLLHGEIPVRRRNFLVSMFKKLFFVTDVAAE